MLCYSSLSALAIHQSMDAYTLPLSVCLVPVSFTVSGIYGGDVMMYCVGVADVSVLFLGGLKLWEPIGISGKPFGCLCSQ
jgi:hypothetical protein